MALVLHPQLIDEGSRLDVFLSKNTEYSRNSIEIDIDNNKVKVNNVVVNKSSYKIKQNDIIELEDREIKVLDVKAEDIKLDIIYEDDDILIINKERGMVVHPSNGHQSGTLVNAVINHCKDNLSSINGVIRPGIVHRIDRGTSGIICICKNDKAHNNIAEQFREHTNIRKYKTIVIGNLKNEEGLIENYINRDKKDRFKMSVSKDDSGKKAITKYRVLERFNNYDLVECELLTGRTHQIRVHMKYLNHPVLGDLLYGHQDKIFKNLDMQMLHAYYLELTHPRTNERMKFSIDLPKDFIDVLNKIKKI